MDIGIHTKSRDTVDARIKEIATQNAVGALLSTMSPLQIANFATTLTQIEDFAQKTGATIKTEGTSICLEKEIGGKMWRILTIDHDKKTIDVVVDVKQFRKACISTELPLDNMQISGYTTRRIHEVRRPLAGIEGREIVTSDGRRKYVNMKIAEIMLPNGDIVRYNTWDFKPHAIFDAQLSDRTISSESPEHKREFVLQVADAFCANDPRLHGVFAPEVEEQLRRIHETRKTPAYLKGYEIHHNGYGEMLLLSKEIHCRKLAHIGGSWLMNTQNYAVYIECQTLDQSVGTILSEELAIDRIESYNEFTIGEKERYIMSIGERILNNTGLSNVNIEFADNLGPTTCGIHSATANKIILNRNLLNNPFDAIHTTLHEIRHAIQHDAVQHPEKYGFDAQTIEIWQRNIAYYISPKLDYEAYVLQPIEIDAETWASKMLHDFKTPLYV